MKKKGSQFYWYWLATASIINYFLCFLFSSFDYFLFLPILLYLLIAINVFFVLTFKTPIINDNGKKGRKIILASSLFGVFLASISLVSLTFYFMGYLPNLLVYLFGPYIFLVIFITKFSFCNLDKKNFIKQKNSNI